jgi:hypothetical protein
MHSRLESVLVPCWASKSSTVNKEQEAEISHVNGAIISDFNM